MNNERKRKREAGLSMAEKLKMFQDRMAQKYAEGGAVGVDQFGTYPMIEEEDVKQAEIAQANEEAKTPTMKTPEELQQDKMKQEAAKTPEGQAAMDSEFDPKKELLNTINKYKEQLNAPKKEYGVMDALPDILAGAYNIGVRANPTGLSEMQIPNSIQNMRRQDQAQRKDQLSGLQNLQNMYAKYMEMQGKSTPKQLSDLDKAKIETEKAKAEKIKKETAEKDMSFEEKERIKFEAKEKLADKKERTKTIKETKQAIQNVDDQIAKIRRAKQLLKDTVKDTTVADTGPLDQYITGMSGEGQRLRQAFNDLSLEKMTKMFAGMSKAIDSDAERKMFEQSQASLSNYPDVNMQILDDMEKAALSLKKKNSALMNELESSDNKSKPQEVRRRTKDGRIAIFNPETKEFIRYEE